MRIVRYLIVMLLTIFVGSSPAFAGKNDDAWAQCLWQYVPTSSSNWLKLPTPKRDYGLAEPPAEYLLQQRLEASCSRKLTAARKKSPPNFNAKAVRSALLLFKPTEIIADLIDPKAFRCSRYFLNDTELKNPAGFEWGYGEGSDRRITSSVTYIFAAQGGGSVGLPDQGGLTKCQWILADGTFSNA